MNESDLISVIIPVHNGEKHINRTIPRLQRQSYKNIEMIIVLNNCTDRSREMCLALAKDDSRIHIIEYDVIGLLLVRKRGILESHGDYICCIDIDDYYADDSALEKMHEAIVQDGVQICQFGHFVRYYDLYQTRVDVVNERRIFSREELFAGPLLGVVPGRGGIFDGALWSKIYDGELLRNVASDIQLPLLYGEDGFLNFAVFTNEKTVKVSSRNEAYYVYRRYGGSMTDSPAAAARILKDYSLFKPVELWRLSELSVSPEIILRVHSESLWAYRASIDSLLKAKAADAEILALIAEAEDYEYIRMTKEYFRTHPENIWAEEMHFMVGDYTPQEYLDWCKAHLPRRTVRERVKSIVKRVLSR